jgi:hypothetical protein
VRGVWNGGLFIEGGTRWEGSEKTLARCDALVSAVQRETMTASPKLQG